MISLANIINASLAMLTGPTCAGVSITRKMMLWNAANCGFVLFQVRSCRLVDGPAVKHNRAG
jgi:hypothetical protein